MNHGALAAEIAEDLTLPDSLQKDWSAHGFYGTLRHNVKAVVQHYLGWYDGNPAHLNPLPPVQAAQKAIGYMGGAAAVLARARADFDAGEYRWVAQVCAQLAHAEGPQGAHLSAACALGANALEQLGYQAESATWRNAYLQAAMELRNGPPQLPPANLGSLDLVRAMPLDLWFDNLAMRLDGDKAEGLVLRIHWQFTDTGETVLLNLENSALTHRVGVPAAGSDAQVTLTRATLDQITMQRLSWPEALQTGALQVAGKPGLLLQLMGLIDRFERMFAVVRARPGGPPID